MPARFKDISVVDVLTHIISASLHVIRSIPYSECVHEFELYALRSESIRREHDIADNYSFECMNRTYAIVCK